MLLSYEDIFTCDSSDLGQTGAVRHTINTGIATPICQQPRRLPPHYQKEVKRLLDEMLHRNIIQRSASSRASPIILVKKKDGLFRFCVDYHKVNNVTKKDAYPLPHVNDMLDTLLAQSDSPHLTSCVATGRYRWRSLIERKLSLSLRKSCLSFR